MLNQAEQLAIVKALEKVRDLGNQWNLAIYVVGPKSNENDFFAQRSRARKG